MTPSRNFWQFACLCLLVLRIPNSSPGNQDQFSSVRQEQFCSKKDEELLPTGMCITPTAAKGSMFERLNPGLPGLPQFTADHPVTSAISPSDGNDGNTLLILTSGYNRNYDAGGNQIAEQSNEYVFIYDISRNGPALKRNVLKIPNAFAGLAWNPNGKEFYVSGGVDDKVYIFGSSDRKWEKVKSGKSIDLEHDAGLGINVKPMAAGLAVNKSGTQLLVANYENDSVSLIDLKSREIIGELDLRPGKNNDKSGPGGEFPFWVAFKGDDKAYVSSLRDREIVVLNIGGQKPLEIKARITEKNHLRGQPNKLLLNNDQTRLFAAMDNSDMVAMIDTAKDEVIANIKTTAPADTYSGIFKGSNPNSLALSPDQQTLYVTNGGTNSVAVIDLKDNQVKGLIPTGWYPESVSVSKAGTLYVVNGKGNAGPNPGCHPDGAPLSERDCQATNQYILQLVKGGLLTIPRIDTAELQRLTKIVAENNYFRGVVNTSVADPIFDFLRGQIKHVIYIVKENRTYDQVLGDLDRGNGDPYLTQFPDKTITPNHHELAREFVTLDNFFDSGEVSPNGWNWSTAARTTDNVEKTVPMNYARRGFSYDFEGNNRNINVSMAAKKDRTHVNQRYAEMKDQDDQLPGIADVNAPDGPEGTPIGTGYLWNSALRIKLKVRNYGFFLDTSRYRTSKRGVAIPLERHPADPDKKIQVAFPAHHDLPADDVSKPNAREVTDPYFRGFDQRFPDYWRFEEWYREFREYEERGDLPSLELLRLSHDHFGDFANALDGINTVETQMADNDYALGLIVKTVAHSEKYRENTLIFVVEDDAQNGPDHVDAHRSVAFVIGPYVKRKAVISQRYNTVSMLRTIEKVLGIEPLGLNDALQPPMTEVFSKDPALLNWEYKLGTPTVLCNTKLPVQESQECKSTVAAVQPRHDASYWARHTKGFDFSVEDKLDSALFNQVLWKGLMGDRPYPAERNGKDLRQGREELLRRFVEQNRSQ